jgi:ArsR family transcriptional regulator, arsenate/arsenite/antimonite-responsive transcriptional repressor
MSMNANAVETSAPVACCTPVAAPAISDDEAGNLASVFRALGDPHRVRIVSMLTNSADPVCVCDVTEVLGLSQATTSFHLKKLTDAGFLRREQRGVWAYYSLVPGALARVADALEEGSG